MKFETEDSKRVEISLYLTRQNLIGATKIIHRERQFKNQQELREEAHKILDEAIDKLYNKK